MTFEGKMMILYSHNREREREKEREEKRIRLWEHGTRRGFSIFVVIFGF